MQRERRQGFLFVRESHGFRYAVGREVLDWLDAGSDVVVNGSRAYLQTALDVYPELSPVWITVPESLLRARLAARGRETAAQIEARLRRNLELEDHCRAACPCIRNDSPIEEALARFDALRGEDRFRRSERARACEENFGEQDKQVTIRNRQAGL